MPEITVTASVTYTYDTRDHDNPDGDELTPETARRMTEEMLDFGGLAASDFEIVVVPDATFATTWVVTRDDDYDHDYDTFVGVASDRATAQRLAEENAQEAGPITVPAWHSRQGDNLDVHPHIEATLIIGDHTRYHVRERRIETQEV